LAATPANLTYKAYLAEFARSLTPFACVDNSRTRVGTLASVYSCAVIGLEAAVVEVEVDTTNGLPSLVDVGARSQRRSPIYGKAGEAD
jgi:hypothetical protein